MNCFNELGGRGLRIERNGAELACRGDQDLLTDEIRQGLREHRGQLLTAIVDSKEEMRNRLTSLTKWLNEAAPDGYQLDETFWSTFDRELEEAIGTGDLNHLDEAIEKLKHRAVAHFMPWHGLPPVGGTIIHFPGHELLEFSWEREAIMSVEDGAEVDLDWP